MKILFFEKRLDVGGTQVNSIELAAAMRDCHGHNVTFFAAPGPMLELAIEKGLDFVAAPDEPKPFSVARLRALSEVLENTRPDLVHVWDWPQCIDALYVASLHHRVPVMSTSMSMTVDRVLPRSLPTTFGTPQLVAQAKRLGRSNAELLLPPVDTVGNSIDMISRSTIRQRYGISPQDILIITVSRLVDWMKAESLIYTVQAIHRLAKRVSVRFLVVGDGTARGQLEERADEANRELKRSVIQFTGHLIDPREAYAAADIVIGMGGSALRAMAFEKPVIVTGEKGFALPFNTRTAEYFYNCGLYGTWDGRDGSERLEKLIQELIDHREDWRDMGRFGRLFVERNFSLSVIAKNLSSSYENNLNRLPVMYFSLADATRTYLVHAAGSLRRSLGRRRSI
jgi:L-malate glycosyltransferase